VALRVWGREKFDRVKSAAPIEDIRRRRELVLDEGIVAVVAVQDIVAGAAIDNVVAGACVDDVVAAQRLNDVCVAGAIDGFTGVGASNVGHDFPLSRLQNRVAAHGHANYCDDSRSRQ
jgi:hypothetical protein